MQRELVVLSLFQCMIYHHHRLLMDPMLGYVVLSKTLSHYKISQQKNKTYGGITLEHNRIRPSGKRTGENFFVQLGPSVRTKVQFGPKQNNKVTHPPPLGMFKGVSCNLETEFFLCTLI